MLSITLHRKFSPIAKRLLPNAKTTPLDGRWRTHHQPLEVSLSRPTSLALEKNRSEDGVSLKRRMLDFSLVRRAILNPRKDEVHALFGERKGNLLLVE
jgi:hypothetical protein